MQRIIRMAALSLCLCSTIVALVSCKSRTSSKTDTADKSAREQTSQSKTASAKRLQTLGYVNQVPVRQRDANKSGVTILERDKYYPGANLFTPRSKSMARLISADGKLLHRWTSDEKGQTYQRFKAQFSEAMPNWLDGWNHATLAENGDIVVLGAHHMLLRLDSASKVLWKKSLAAHHDAKFLESGDILTLTKSLRKVRLGSGTSVYVQDCGITLLTGDGKIKSTQSIYDALLSNEQMRERLTDIIKKIPEKLRNAAKNRLKRASSAKGSPSERRRSLQHQLLLRSASLDDDLDLGIRNIILSNTVADIFHANSVQAVPSSIPGLWEKGDYLVSLLKLDSIAVISARENKLRWIWGSGVLDRQHHATQMSDGNIVLFDNGKHRRFSRILVVDPRKAKIVWEYAGNPKESFFSASRGSVQPLANGNFLISETNSGRVFEVTPTKEIVWEYFEEIVQISGRAKKRDAIYRMTRMADSQR